MSCQAAESQNFFLKFLSLSNGEFDKQLRLLEKYDGSKI